MINWIKNLYKKHRCDHEYECIRNIYGEEINQCGGYRSIWKCNKCGKITYSYTYHLSIGGQLNKLYNNYYINKYENWKKERQTEFKNIIKQMKDNASKGMCWFDIILFCDTDKNEAYYYEKWFKENDLKVADITEECKEDVQIKPYKFHITWA